MCIEVLNSQEMNVSPDSLISVTLRDGTIIKGKMISGGDEVIIIKTLNDLEVKIPWKSILSIDKIRELKRESRWPRSDPNYSRLMYAPTGRPLKKGEGYLSDYYVFFPGISYGLTDNISVMAGISALPGIGVSEQLRYIAPRFGIQTSDKIALSGGILYISFGGEFSGGVAFATGTIGEPDKSLTFGLGFGYGKWEDDFEWADRPIIVLGGNIRLTNSLALVSENWILMGDEFDAKKQPFGLALRFFGERIAVDAGVILIQEVLKEGFPIPWLSFIYHFGR